METINVYLKVGIELFGVVLILLSLNSNMKRLNGNGLLSPIKEWVLKNPFRKPKTIYLHGTASSISSMVGDISLTYNKNMSIEEKVNELIKENKKRKSEIKELSELLNTQRNEINEDINKLEIRTNDYFKDLSDKMKDTIIGDIRPQLLGLFLIIYGIFI